MGETPCQDIAALPGTHPNSVAESLDRGLRLELNHPPFKSRLDRLDAAMSERGCQKNKGGSVRVAPFEYHV